jgi:tetratricopeptide (TPR) repeat protein
MFGLWSIASGRRHQWIAHLIESRRYDLAQFEIDQPASKRLSEAQRQFFSARIARLKGDPRNAERYLDLAHRAGIDPNLRELEHFLLKMSDRKFADRYLLFQQLERLKQQFLQERTVINDAFITALVSNGEHSLGVELVIAWCGEEPTNALAWYWRGVIATQSPDQQAEAQQSFTQAVSLNPDLLDARLQLAASLQAQKRFADSAEQFQYVVNQIGQENSSLEETTASRWVGLMGLAACAVGEGKTDRATELLRSACELQPRAYPSRFGLAEQCLAANRLEEALQSALLLFEWKPDDGALNYLLSSIYTKLGNEVSATECFDRFQSIQREIEGLQSRGLALNQPPTSGVDPRGTSPNVLIGLGRDYLRYRWQVAGEWLHRAERMAPHDMQIAGLLSEFYATGGNLRLANKYRAVERRHGSPGPS